LIGEYAVRAAKVLFVIFMLALSYRAAVAGEALDPHKTTLPIYLLPETAAADGDLTEWGAVPPVTSEKFKDMHTGEAITPSADFAPTLRCGRTEAGLDLYFLVVVRDTNTWAENTDGWLSGDFLELYLDFGRAKRREEDPDWYKESNWQGTREMGQFGFQPRTLRTAPLVRHATNAANWKIDYASVPIAGGIAYELRLDVRSVLDDLKLAELPPYIGIDLGFADQDYPIYLKAGHFENRDGFYRLFGDGRNHIFPIKYGMLSTKPISAPERPLAPLPKTLRELYGESPGEDAIREGMKNLSGEELADLVRWAGLQGVKLNEKLVMQLPRPGDPRIMETCLAVAAYTDQDKALAPLVVAKAYQTIEPGVTAYPDKKNAESAVYVTVKRATPQALIVANLLVEKHSLQHREELARLLMHDDMTVAFTAAGALAKVGRAADAAVIQEALDTVCTDLDENAGITREEAAIAKGSYRVFFRDAIDALLTRTAPVPVARSAAQRQIRAENTDLPRHLPIDNNNVYNAAGLLRNWPAGGPKELWRAEVGAGIATVVEAGGRAFTAGRIDDGAHALCFDALTGEIVWQYGLGSGDPDVTPVADGDRVYYARGGIVCLSAKDGTEIWSEQKAYSCSSYSSPLVVGDVLYIGARHPSGLVAADKFTGEFLWAAGNGSPCSPGSPAYQIVENIPQVIVGVARPPGTAEVWGVDVKTAKVFWTRSFNADYGPCASPVVVGSRVYLCGGHGRYFSECLQIFVVDGALQARSLYVKDDVQTNSHNTVAVLDGLVYGFGMGGLQCTRLEGGSVVWQQKWSIDRHLILADGLLFITTPKGEIVMAEASKDGYKELGRVATKIDLSGDTQQITIANGRLYVRGKKQVVCYDLVNEE